MRISSIICGRFGAAVLLCAAMTLAACSVVDTDTTVPDGALLARSVAPGGSPAVAETPRSEFYPLEVGNRWEYSGSQTLWMVGGYPVTMHSYESRTLTGYETLFDREYLIEEQAVILSSMPPAVLYWLRYRQDKAGLYEADVSMTDPPGDDGAGALRTTGSLSPWPRLFAELAARTPDDKRDVFETARELMRQKLALVGQVLGGTGRAMLAGPPGGVLPDEITRLRYPLHVGQEWVVRETPLFSSVVEGHEVLDLPAGRFGGWRIRMASEMFGPNDRVLLWYGRDGLLSIYARLEVEVTGPTGEPEGTMVSEETLVLEKVEIR
jgi:hypothetical protein